MARDERAELVDLLVTLTPKQWDAPTLCSEWRVRDVVAHMVSYDELGTLGLVGRFLRERPDPGGRERPRGRRLHGSKPRRANCPGQEQPAAQRADRRVRRPDRAHRRTIHQQDIRRPLGLPRHIPPQRLATVLKFAKTAPTIGAAKRIRGLTLTATDLDWTTGQGPASRDRQSHCSWHSPVAAA